MGSKITTAIVSPSGCESSRLPLKVACKRTLLTSLLWLCYPAVDALAEILQPAPLSLEQAVELAQQHDPWLVGSRLREQASLSRAVAAQQLPDPEVSLGFANLPVDSVDFEREPMTQLKLGVSQSFPRGDSRSLKRQQLEQMSQQQPLLRQDRKARLRLSVSQLWLDVYRNRETIRLIEKDRALFEHLVDVAESNYSSAQGSARQQDLVRAQLELTRLEDRLTVLHQQHESAAAQLGEWLPHRANDRLRLSDHLPSVFLADEQLIRRPDTDQALLGKALQQHPMIRQFQQQIMAGATGVSLARQKYKPQWGINASYGYRDDDPVGTERSDFFSVGVSFDLPLFTHNRQDREVQAAIYNQQALTTDRALALRSMHSRFEVVKSRWLRLNQRKVLYETRLLEEIHQQADASLTAYTRDDGDFAEVVRARIAALNANIDLLNINVDRLQALAELNYFMTAYRDNDLANEQVVSLHE